MVMVRAGLTSWKTLWLGQMVPFRGNLSTNHRHHQWYSHCQRHCHQHHHQHYRHHFQIFVIFKSENIITEREGQSFGKEREERGWQELERARDFLWMPHQPLVVPRLLHYHNTNLSTLYSPNKQTTKYPTSCCTQTTSLAHCRPLFF